MKFSIPILTVGLAFTLTIGAWGAVPKLINFQGILHNGGGQPVTDSTYTVSFRIYNAPTGGTLLWTETQSVTTTDGLFTVILGTTSPVPDSAFNDTTRYLGIMIAPDPEMTPREELVSVAYGYRVNSVDQALGGHILTKVAIGPGNTNIGLNAFATGADNTASGDSSTVGGGTHNTASNTSATVSGGYSNLASREYSTVGGGRWDTAAALGSVVGGGSLNVATGEHGTVGGGYGNRATGPFDATVGGGEFNTASGDRATVDGGTGNTASGTRAYIGGGYHNIASSSDATVGGGFTNTASGPGATVAGGGFNRASGLDAAVGGGDGHVASGDFAVVSGGWRDTASGRYAAIGGGLYNNASDTASTIGGGRYNRARGVYSVVCGGGGATTADSNAALGMQSIVGGGSRNVADGYLSTIAGGYVNHASGIGASIVGGSSNLASGPFNSFVGGGFANQATGQDAAIGGGNNNIAGPADQAAVGGGVYNIASGIAATIPGGALNVAAGSYSLAAGRRARALHRGTFVWADSSVEADFSSTANNQFLIRAAGGVGIGTSSPGARLHVDSGDVFIGGVTTPAAPGTNLYLGDIGSDANNSFRFDAFNNDLYMVARSGPGSAVGTSIRFRTAAAGAGEADRMRIMSTGNVGIGTTAPTSLLSVNGAASNTTGVWAIFSDRRLKRDIEPMVGALETVTRLKGVTFHWRDAEKDAQFGRVRGLVAQDVEEVLPEWVKTDPDGYKRIEPIGVDALLIEAIKELEAENKSLEMKVAHLDELEAEVLRLEHAVDLVVSNHGGMDKAVSASQGTMGGR